VDELRMLNRMRSKASPFHKAVIEGNLELVVQLKDSEWSSLFDVNGFNPLELAQLLGLRQCQELLSNLNPIEIKVQLKDQKSPSLLSIIEFENLFKVIYRPFLTFLSYRSLEEIIHNCPYLLRFEWLMTHHDKSEAFYQAQLSIGAIADVFIKWINPVLEYGLFAAVDLLEKSFIGEYTGVVRRIDKAHPNLNAYCFHYPTRFWSLKYFVIDSLHEGNLLRFINHSDQPNLQPLWLVNRGVLHLIFIANCFITKGTELTFNYGPDYWIRRKKAM
jgi:uncharacterized protein